MTDEDNKIEDEKVEPPEDVPPRVALDVRVVELTSQIESINSRLNEIERKCDEYHQRQSSPPSPQPGDREPTSGHWYFRQAWE